jgi:hypothetical protein
MQPVAIKRPRGPRLLLRAGLALAAVAVVWTPQPAAAYEPFTLGGSCSALTWTSAPRVVVHTDELPDGPDFFGDNLRMLVAVNEVNDELNDVAATSAQISSTTTSSEPFTQEVWFNDATPTIHVGFHDDPNGELGSGGPGPTVNCEYDEAHIGFKRADLANWNFGTPEDGGQEYYDATQNDISGARYFRLSYLHELLHTFGLDHSDSSYSMMNYGDRPWSDKDTIRPLPDDVAGLRALYPEPLVGASDVAVHNTWYTQIGKLNGAAQQEHYCDPSLGDMFVFDMFSEYCAFAGPDSGSTQICWGSELHTRFTVANYSTDEADLTARLWLSPDDEWDPSDKVSPTRHTYDVSAADSDSESETWEMPNLGIYQDDYYVIVRVRGTTASGRSVDGWTPLGETVQYELSECVTAQEAHIPIDPR